jgi:hypothetical protein
MSDFQEIEEDETNKDDQHPVLSEIFDSQFVNFLSKLEADIRENIMDIFSRTKTATAVLPTELEQKNGEVDGEYIKRLKSFVEKQCNEMQVGFHLLPSENSLLNYFKNSKLKNDVLCIAKKEKKK